MLVQSGTHTQKKNIDKIEAVQNRAARWTLNKTRRGPNSGSITAMKEQLKWTPLAIRRKNARLIMLYKIVNGLVAMDVSRLLVPLNHFHRTKYAEPHRYFVLDTSPQLYYCCSFFPRTIQQWNSLDCCHATVPTLDAFRAQLLAQQAN